MRNAIEDAVRDPFVQDSTRETIIAYYGSEEGKRPYALRDALVKIVQRNSAWRFIPGSRTSVKSENGNTLVGERFVLFDVPHNAFYVYEFAQRDRFVNESLECASPSHFDTMNPAAPLTVVLGPSNPTESQHSLRSYTELQPFFSP